jgi:hypothetical protein
MVRKYFLAALSCSVLMICTGISVSAQTGQLRGHVVVKQADGTTIPGTDAAIDVFRTDLPGKYTTKTDKKGDFVFAGLPYVGTYIIGVSRAAAQPFWLPNVKAGRDIDYALELSPGDGRRLTLEEIKSLMAKTPATQSGDTKPSSEDKAKREEIEKKNAEIVASNKKAEASNAIIDRTFKAGNEALRAKNYDAAIAHFDEGLTADPDHPGAPALLTNKTLALTARAVDKYNAAIQSKDDSAKATALEAAKKDWKEASEASTKAVAMLKAMPAASDAASANNAKLNLYFALMARAEAMRLFVSKVDATQADAGLAAFKDYIAAEADPAKKAKAQLDAAQMLLDAGAVDKSYTEYRAILTAQPDNPDANLGAGLSLFASGDKAKYQEAANFLQHYVDVAPDTHKFKADAKAILTELKNTEKVVPQASPTRRRVRP